MSEKSNSSLSPAMPCPFEKIHPSELQRDDEYYMKLAYNQAIKAWRANEVPIGAVIEFEGEVIAAAHNEVETTGDATAHAEMVTITKAGSRLGDWRLNGATLYVTKEPCPMCSGAATLSRLARVVFGARDPEMGCLGGAVDLNALLHLNHKFTVTAGILEPLCRELLQAFFAEKRKSPQNKLT